MLGTDEQLYDAITILLAELVANHTGQLNLGQRAFTYVNIGMGATMLEPLIPVILPRKGILNKDRPGQKQTG
ncbi:hypothetical protein PYJP_07010 [Pyrofollis japonicus]|nr:hypothetical protein PYJP_07010 [Pyrofollis japonicus]